MTELLKIQQKILDFRNERDWAQFHEPKKLAEAVSIEAGELWKLQGRCVLSGLIHCKVSGNIYERHPGQNFSINTQGRWTARTCRSR